MQPWHHSVASHALFMFCGELDFCAAAESGVVTIAATNSLLVRHLLSFFTRAHLFMLVFSCWIPQFSGTNTCAPRSNMKRLTSLCRHGRLERCVLVPPPPLAARFDILTRHLQPMCDVTVGHDCIRATATATKGFSGADLENLCRSAGVFATARGAAFVSPNDLSQVPIWYRMIHARA